MSSAAQAVLAKGNAVPGLPRFSLGERVHQYDGHSIWTLYDGKEVRWGRLRDRRRLAAAPSG